METNINSKPKKAGVRRPVTVALVFAFALMYLFGLGAAVLRFGYDAKDISALSYVLIAIGAAAILVSLFVYFVYSRRGLIHRTGELTAVIVCLCMGYTACLGLSLVTVYLMPVAVTAFLIAPIARRRDAFVCSLACNVMIISVLLIAVRSGAPFEVYDVLAVALTGIAAGSLAAYNVSNDTKRLSYVWKGIVVGIVGIVLMFACFAVRGAFKDFLSQLMYMAIAVVAQVLAGLVLQPIVEKIFNLVTNSRLVELTDRNSPLIKRLRNEALGTFSHCMSVANFAEMCAVAIGENPYLARACAYYHDVGKLANPLYYKENQAGHTNPHDDLLPEVSAEIIRGHTSEGLKLCRKYRIPEEISHVTVQHHGTLLIPVFYEKAKKLTDSDVDPYDYSYHGITPVTKMAAIIMICDSGEAAIRAMDKPDGEKVDKLIKSLIDARIAAGQFDNCDISLRDLNTIRSTIVGSFGGLYHERLKYPDGK